MGSRIRDNVRHLFECFCEVAAGDKDTEPFVRKKYPDSYKNEEELKSLPKFAFPCELDSNVIQRFSFVLTSADSKYTFCFCRYDPNTSSALVIMSHLPWHDVFYKLLSSIASLINKGARSELTAFLDACRIRPPMPGHTLRVTYNSDQSVFTCQSPEAKLPSIPENCNLNEYYSAVDSRCMAGLWAALLNERRVAIVASKPSRLSATVQAANSTLYPMAWQHIFIPVLPKHLAEYLLAPMPFLVGVPRSVMETVKMNDIGDVVILDADASTIQSPFNDLDSLPFEVVSGLKRALKNKNELMGDAVSRAFLRALVQLIGGYKEAIRIEKKDEGGVKITFNRDAFVKTRRPALQPFLKKILNLQIFQQFIEERLEVINSGRGFNDEFETECRLYEEESNAGSGGLRQQYKEWTKTVKREGGALLKTVKDKANPAVKSAVKSVRQGGKGVRSAVKGLKTRMRDGGHRTHSPRPSSANFIDDSRLSYESTTPVSSGSSDSLQSGSSSRSPTNSPPGLRLDLLNEMEVLLSKSDSAHRSSSLSVNDGSSIFAEISSMDKAKTLSGRMPPRPPARPVLPPRYPIVPTRTLVDVSDAPPPPPRSHTSVRDKVSFFTSHITKDEPNPSAALPRTVNPIQFEPSGKDHKNLTASTSVQNLQNPKKNALSLPKVTRQLTQIPNTINGITTSASVKDIIKNANALDKSPGRLPLTIAKSPPSTTPAVNKKMNRHEVTPSLISFIIAILFVILTNLYYV